LETGTLIILLMLGLFLATIAWWVFRIIRFRRRKEEIDRLSMEIADLSSKTKVKRKKPPSPKLPRGDLLIILHRNGGKPWKRSFRESLRSGVKSMIVTARTPRDVRSQYDGDYRIVWLNRSMAHEPEEGVRLVNPTNLSGVVDEADNYFRSSEGGIILLDGFDEMIHSNDIGRILRFLRTIKERAADGKISVVAPLNYKATHQRVRNQLTESFEAVVI